MAVMEMPNEKTIESLSKLANNQHWQEFIGWIVDSQEKAVEALKTCEAEEVYAWQGQIAVFDEIVDTAADACQRLKDIKKRKAQEAAGEMPDQEDEGLPEGERDPFGFLE